VLSVTIDTAVFAPPPLGSAAEDVHSFVATLLEWRDAMNDGRLDVYTSVHAPEVLGDSDLYPIRPRLKELLREAAVFEYDANTVAVLAETILNRSGKIEDLLGISDVLVDDITIQPDVFASHSPAALRDEAQRCAAVVSIASRYLDEPRFRCHAIAIRATDVGAAVRVRGIILEIAHSRDDLGGLPLAPAYFEGSTFVCSSFHRLLMTLDEIDILRWAKTGSHLATAVKIGIYKRFSSLGKDVSWEDLPAFDVGHKFFDSLQTHHVAADSGLAEKLIRAIVETVCHENLPATHALRKGDGGNDPQKMRGKDAAWRRDVDYEYHLHYWECATGVVELAVVVAHNDSSIPE
jgi:hypothetical protein